MILINMLFLQPGPHPAPMVKSGDRRHHRAGGPTLAGTGADAAAPAIAAQPEGRAGQGCAGAGCADTDRTGNAGACRPRRVRPSSPTSSANCRAAASTTASSTARYGPRTDAAIRDFEQAAGLRPSTEPNEALLRAIKRSPVRSRPRRRPPGADTAGAARSDRRDARAVEAGDRGAAGALRIRLRPDQADRHRRSARRRRRSRNSSASASCRSPASCPTASCASSRHHRPAAGIAGTRTVYLYRALVLRLLNRHTRRERPMRLKSAIWVAAYIRRCNGEGAFAVVRRRGAEDAGAIFIKLNRLDGTAELFAPAPQTAFDDARPADRAFSRVVRQGAGARAEGRGAAGARDPLRSRCLDRRGRGSRRPPFHRERRGVDAVR